MSFQKHPIFKIQSVHPFKLEKLKHAPNCAGVYFITTFKDEKETLYYIGSSNQLKQRFGSHEIIRELKKMRVFYTIYVLPDWESEYQNSEKYYIKKFLPFRNINLRTT